MDKEKYTRIPNSICDSLFQNDMTLSELKVYCLIIRQTHGFNRPTTKLSNGYIAKKTGTTVRNANKVVRSLEKKGYIKIHNKGGGSHNAREVSVKNKQCPTVHPSSEPQFTPNDEPQFTVSSEPQFTPNDEPQFTVSSEPQFTQENKYIKNNILNKTKEKEIAFLNSLPERMRVLNPSDLSDEDFCEWSDRRDAWEAEHGEIYAEDDE